MREGANVNPNRPPISVGRKKSCGNKKCKKVRRRGFLGIGRRVAEDWCTGTPPDRCTCLGDPCGQSARVSTPNPMENKMQMRTRSVDQQTPQGRITGSVTYEVDPMTGRETGCSGSCKYKVKTGRWPFRKTTKHKGVCEIKNNGDCACGDLACGRGDAMITNDGNMQMEGRNLGNTRPTVPTRGITRAMEVQARRTGVRPIRQGRFGNEIPLRDLDRGIGVSSDGRIRGGIKRPPLFGDYYL